VIAYAARRLKEGEGDKESLLLTLARRLKEGKEIKRVYCLRWLGY
jgi:hypothetical protein